MQDSGKAWALVLAAGEGSRLRELTRDAHGNAVPKQFCSLQGEASLLQDALERAATLAPVERTCAIVAASHRRWWSTSLRLPGRNVIVQPENRGTANGVLLPLLHILERDPDACLAILPSDHYVREEAILTTSLQEARRHCMRHPERILLLGMEPDDADPELGYIVPEVGTSRVQPRPVKHFLEKPPVPAARDLISRGGLWNVFIVVSTARTLLDLYTMRYPEIVMEMCAVLHATGYSSSALPAMIDLYDRLPSLDFSRHILEGCEPKLDVLTVPQCGWSDLGTPRRVVATLRRLHGSHLIAAAMAARNGTYVNLAARAGFTQPQAPAD